MFVFWIVCLFVCLFVCFAAQAVTRHSLKKILFDTLPAGFRMLSLVPRVSPSSSLPPTKSRSTGFSWPSPPGNSQPPNNVPWSCRAATRLVRSLVNSVKVGRISGLQFFGVFVDKLGVLDPKSSENTGFWCPIMLQHIHSLRRFFEDVSSLGIFQLVGGEEFE